MMKLLGAVKSKKTKEESKVGVKLVGNCKFCELKNFPAFVRDPIPGERNKAQRFEFIREEFAKDAAVIKKNQLIPSKQLLKIFDSVLSVQRFNKASDQVTDQKAQESAKAFIVESRKLLDVTDREANKIDELYAKLCLEQTKHYHSALEDDFTIYDDVYMESIQNYFSRINSKMYTVVFDKSIQVEFRDTQKKITEEDISDTRLSIQNFDKRLQKNKQSFEDFRMWYCNTADHYLVGSKTIQSQQQDRLKLATDLQSYCKRAQLQKKISSRHLLCLVLSYKRNEDEIKRVDKTVREDGTKLQRGLNFCSTQTSIPQETISKNAKERSTFESSMAEVMNNISLLNELYRKKDELARHIKASLILNRSIYKRDVDFITHTLESVFMHLVNIDFLLNVGQTRAALNKLLDDVRHRQNELLIYHMEMQKVCLKSDFSATLIKSYMKQPRSKGNEDIQDVQKRSKINMYKQYNLGELIKDKDFCDNLDEGMKQHILEFIAYLSVQKKFRKPFHKRLFSDRTIKIRQKDKIDYTKIESKIDSKNQKYDLEKEMSLALSEHDSSFRSSQTSKRQKLLSSTDANMSITSPLKSSNALQQNASTAQKQIQTPRNSSSRHSLCLPSKKKEESKKDYEYRFGLRQEWDNAINAYSQWPKSFKGEQRAHLHWLISEVIKVKERKFAQRYKYQHRKDILSKAFAVFDETFLNFKQFDSYIDRIKSKMMQNRQENYKLHELIHDFTLKQNQNFTCFVRDQFPKTQIELKEKGEGFIRKKASFSDFDENDQFSQCPQIPKGDQNCLTYKNVVHNTSLDPRKENCLQKRSINQFQNLLVFSDSPKTDFNHCKELVRMESLAYDLEERLIDHRKKKNFNMRPSAVAIVNLYNQCRQSRKNLMIYLGEERISMKEAFKNEFDQISQIFTQQLVELKPQKLLMSNDRLSRASPSKTIECAPKQKETPQFVKESIEVAEPQFGQNTNVQIMLIFKFVKYEICREIIQKNRQPNFNIYLLENESYGRAIHEK